MPLVSIVVPVYKVEAYIRRCVDSILAQSFDNFELILVDDGSPDNCPMICEEFATQDPRVRVIHKLNGGLSSARNAGLRIACGKYVMFVDSDDYVHEDWCAVMYQSLLSHPNAWIVSNIARVNSMGECHVVSNVANSCDNRQSYYDIYRMGLSPYVWNKIYDLQKIRQINLQFDELCSFGEDIAFNTAYYETCSEIVYIPKVLYYYFVNAFGIMGTYRNNLFELNLPHFAVRLPLIQAQEIPAFCDDYLYYFLSWLDNTMDPRNTMKFRQKMRYNHRMMNTVEFRYCTENAAWRNYSKLFMKIVRLHNYYIYWLFKQVCAIKAKLDQK